MTRARLTAADLRYDEATHTSTAPDGRPVPHVTAVIGAAGLGTDFEELRAMGVRQQADIEMARARGRAAHMDCHALDDGDLVMDTVDPRVLPYVEAWMRCREDMGLVPEQRERRLFHRDYWYTGIMDGTFLRTVGRRRLRILGDLKTGDPSSSACHLQTAAYEMAWLLDNPGQRVHERWGIWLTPGRSVPYRIFNYSDPEKYPETAMHGRIFAAAVTVYGEQVRQGRVRGGAAA